MNELAATLPTGDPASVAAVLRGVDVLVPVMSPSPDAPVALFEGPDGSRALYAFSCAHTLEAWAQEVGDDGSHRTAAGALLGEMALDQGVDGVFIDPGSPNRLGLQAQALALLLAGHEGTVLPTISGVHPATGPDAKAVAAALAAVLEWDPVRSAWLFVRAAGNEEVLTVAMAGVDFDGAVSRCQRATSGIPQGLPLDVIAVDDEQEAWLAAEIPGARLDRRGMPSAASGNPALTDALRAGDQAAIGAALRAGTVVLAESTVADGERRVDLFTEADGRTAVYGFSSTELFADWAGRSGHEGGHRTVAAAELGELLRVTGVDGITLDAGAEHALTFEASSLARALAGVDVQD